jgi:hypothetical protein
MINEIARTLQGTDRVQHKFEPKDRDDPDQPGQTPDPGTLNRDRPAGTKHQPDPAMSR